mmetsp:Transcript_51438/g.120712  ORF Transcript_51438/g.120712 Transcript_51438/m.120712 type:complete len:285 (+) Transcript_51438:2-856(+)
MTQQISISHSSEITFVGNDKSTVSIPDNQNVVFFQGRIYQAAASLPPASQGSKTSNAGSSNSEYVTNPQLQEEQLRQVGFFWAHLSVRVGAAAPTTTCRLSCTTANGYACAAAHGSACAAANGHACTAHGHAWRLSLSIAKSVAKHDRVATATVRSTFARANGPATATRFARPTTGFAASGDGRHVTFGSAKHSGTVSTERPIVWAICTERPIIRFGPTKSGAGQHGRYERESSRRRCEHQLCGPCHHYTTGDHQHGVHSRLQCALTMGLHSKYHVVTADAIIE